MDELERQRELLLQAQQEFAQAGAVGADTFRKTANDVGFFSSRIKSAGQKIDDFSKTLSGRAIKATGKATADLGRGFIDTAKAARENRTSFESLNGVIRGAARALDAIPLVGSVLGETLEGVGTFVTAELQKTVESFGKLGSVGAISADGLTEMRTNAERAGLSFQQLAEITASNSKGLAFATGSTAEGARALSRITAAAEPFRQELLNLGIGINEQSEVFANFLAMNQRLGRAQTNDYNRLAQGANDYADQLSVLSRLTGESITGVQAELESQQANIRFRASLRTMESKTMQEGAQNIAAVIGQVGGPEMRQGIQDLFSGAVTPSSRALMLATGNEAVNIISDFRSGAIDQAEALARFQEAAAARREQIGDKAISQFAGLGSAMDPALRGLYELADAESLNREQILKTIKEAEESRKTQDKTTKSVTGAQLEMQKFANNLDKFVTAMLPNAAEIINKFSAALASVTAKLNSKFGDSFGEGADEEIPLTANVVNLHTNSINGLIAGAAADGGPIDSGKPYLVGEEGPELVIPEVAANVFTAEQTKKALDKISSAQSFVNTMIPRIQNMDPSASIETSSGETFARNNSREIFGYGGLYSYSGAHGDIWYDRLGEWTRIALPMMAEGLGRYLYSDGNKGVKFGFSGGANEYLLDAQNNLIKQYVKASFGGVMQDQLTDLLERTITSGEKLSYARADGSFGNMYTQQKMSFDQGGIASGPKSGYTAMLHGTEAVVPLPDGRTIPVEVKNSESNGELVKLMQNMLPLLQQVASNTKTGADTSKQLLRASTA